MPRRIAPRALVEQRPSPRLRQRFSPGVRAIYRWQGGASPTTRKWLAGHQDRARPFSQRWNPRVPRAGTPTRWAGGDRARDRPRARSLTSTGCSPRPGLTLQADGRRAARLKTRRLRLRCLLEGAWDFRGGRHALHAERRRRLVPAFWAARHFLVAQPQAGDVRAVRRGRALSSASIPCRSRARRNSDSSKVWQPSLGALPRAPSFSVVGFALLDQVLDPGAWSSRISSAATRLPVDARHQPLRDECLSS